MSEGKSPAASSSSTDIEKQDNEKNLESENNEPLEKIKEKRPPGINASLVLLYAVFFSMFTTGVVNIMNCPVCIFIPIYLIVAGFVGALAKFLSKSTNKYIYNTAIILVVFDVLWHGVGSYFVYSNYRPNFAPNSGTIYCNRITFLLAFWIITLKYTLIVFFIFFSSLYMLMRGEITFKSSYFVYGNYQPNYEPNSGEDYCNRTTFLLAFWTLTFQYTLLGFFILLSACYMLMRGDFKKK